MLLTYSEWLPCNRTTRATAGHITIIIYHIAAHPDHQRLNATILRIRAVTSSDISRHSSGF